MGWPEGYGRVVLDEVDSTNAEAQRRLAGASGPVWILAHRQTAGRGRRGRAWVMPRGNFAATLVLFPDAPPAERALRSFVAALALRDALAEVTGTAAGLGLKWPNDVLLNGGKLAGILLEGLADPRGALAIGIGVNLIAHPDPSEVEARAVAPVSVLAETGVRVAPEVLLQALAARFAHWEDQLRTYGFAPVRAAWLEGAVRLGEVITARMAQREVTGTFETVDDSGALVLKTAQGREAISAAEIFF